MERCFTSVLITWLNGDEARVEKLVEALRYPGVDHKRLAREIEGDKRSEFDTTCIQYLCNDVLSTVI